MQNGSACRTVLHAEWFCTQSGTACRTVQHAERFSTQNGSARRTVQHAERFFWKISITIYISIYTHLLFGFHFVLHAERFCTQNGSACKTVLHAERFRTQQKRSAEISALIYISIYIYSPA